jgi:hypothetical protein
MSSVSVCPDCGAATMHEPVCVVMRSLNGVAQDPPGIALVDDRREHRVEVVVQG